MVTWRVLPNLQVDAVDDQHFPTLGHQFPSFLVVFVSARLIGSCKPRDAESQAFHWGVCKEISRCGRASIPWNSVQHIDRVKMVPPKTTTN